ncbi:MAG: DegT/DnrJ/EryC1/StrS family aminotransferase [Nanoarchaeota archaeon]
MKVEVEIPKEEDQIVQRVKDMYRFKTKNQALNFIIKNFLIEKKQYEQIGVGFTDISELEKKYVNQVLDSERLSYGPFLKSFEKKIASIHECKFAVAVNSGTDALRIAIACLKETENWVDGDEIICPSVTFISTSNMILENDLRPVFVDIESRTYNLDYEKIERAINRKTRAIMVVHLFGQPADMSEIMRIAKKHKLKVIEDSCETIFSKYKGKSVGSFGDISCFSTYAAHIIATGVGGVALTNNPKYAEIMRSIANHGRDGIYISIDDDKNKKRSELKEIVERRFKFIRLGHSARITEMEGAIGLAQLERADEILSKRKVNAAYLISKLKKFEKFIQLPIKRGDRDHSYMMFPIVIKKNSGISKQELVLFLENNNIETRDMLPLLNQPVYKKIFGDVENNYPVAKWVNDYGFYIGCHQRLTKEQIDYVIDKFEEFFRVKYIIDNKNA